MAPTKREASNPRLFTFSMVVEARREELLMITILAPLPASFSTAHNQKMSASSRLRGEPDGEEQARGSRFGDVQVETAPG